jgi:hypothetical protein
MSKHIHLFATFVCLFAASIQIPFIDFSNFEGNTCVFGFAIGCAFSCFYRWLHD